jgi:hypothetical protein
MTTVRGTMTDDRKNIKVDPATFKRLKNEKRKRETWAWMLHRLLDMTEEHRRHCDDD